MTTTIVTRPQAALSALALSLGLLVGPLVAREGLAQDAAETAKEAAKGAVAAVMPVAGEVTVSAAASLTSSFKEIGTAFHAANAGATATMNFAGSPTLVQQILEGAPVDVFASADEPSMKRVADAGKIASTLHIFARNHLAIAVAKGNPKKITGLADLAKPGLVVSLCGPTVPAGRYAREAFAKAGVAVPKSSEELDVKAAVSRVVMGEADAAVVYVTDVRAAGSEVQGVDIPANINVEASYPIAVLKGAKNPAGAAAFLSFVLGSEGQAILRRAGFLAP